MNSLIVLSEEALQDILVDSKRVGTSLDFIRMVEDALQQKIDSKQMHAYIN
ncbi:hypothetical protein [Rossellomorea sp. DA94]|uniref:hypothetical protein n=1 Tax=Rossellomorea sp. DA94 TaxID=3038653 RepID=UPI00244A561D|nr:hypothetical protein [Rossellomorea sp. DA94]WGG44190.1 hypothetical protein P8596_15540 [Rossellomorea sp. DA94]